MKKLAVLMSVALFLVLAQGGWAANIHVSPAGGGDGSAASPTDLQTALNMAAASAGNDTIFVLQGTYPATATFTYAATGTDTSSLLVSGGWSAGFAYQSPSFPSLTLIDGQDARRVLKITASGAGVNVTVTLENLTVQNGYTNEYAASGDTGNGAGISATNLDGARLRLVMEWCDVLDNETAHLSSVGGGLYLTSAAALRHVNFRRNLTKYTGGGLQATYAPPYTQSLAPTIEDSMFWGNRAYNDSVPNYGGAHVFTNVAPVFRNTTFSGLGAAPGGSGVLSHNGGHPTFRNCVFSVNVSNFYGGAIQFWDGGGDILGCLFLGNEAGAGGDGAGGALAMYDPSPDSPRAVTVVNCTFVGNITAGYQGNGGAIHNRVLALTVANSIFWDNGTQANKGGSYALIDETTAATVDYSDVQGGLGYGFSGSNNITVPPYAGDPWEYPYFTAADSPCLDAGNNDAVPADLIDDYAGHPRIFGVTDRETMRVDMGWSEYYDGELSISSPTKGSVWLNDGRVKTIAWTCTNIPGNVRLSLWRDSPAEGGTEVPRTAASVPCAAGSYGWRMPLTLADRDDYVIVLQSLALPAVVQWSYFATQHLQLTAPNRGNLTQGATYNIRWKSGGLAGALVRIELYSGDRRVRVIARAAPNSGRYAWRVPFTVTPGGGYRVRVSTTRPRVAEDFSNGYFSVLPAITLTAPNGGEVWQRGTVKKITWSYRNSPGTAVRLELYRGAAFDRTLAVSARIGSGGVGSYRWRIPADLPADTLYWIKVRSASWTKCFDFSDNAFSVTE